MLSEHEILIKTIHVAAATISLGLFAVRGFWMLWFPDYLKRTWVRVLPHGVDTLLLVSGLLLITVTRQYPGKDAWLTAKLVALSTSRWERSRSSADATATSVARPSPVRC